MSGSQINGSLLLHIMKEKQRRFRSFTGRLKQDEDRRMTETRIYIGLNDADTGEQLYETGQYMDQLKTVCQRYQVPFSVDVEDGGYYHEDGRYVEETSFVLVLIDAGEDIVRGIAKDLCTQFNQESVLVTEDHLEGYFVNGN